MPAPPGTQLPPLCLPAIGPEASDGQLCLATLAGRRAVLFFYPRDNTPACTTEAQDFSRLAPDFAATGTALIGLSRDTLASHRRFAEKQGLTVTLAADTDPGLADALGVWGEKQLYGRRYMGLHRTTFLIGLDLRVLRVWEGVKVKGHAEAVLTSVRELAA